MDDRTPPGFESPSRQGPPTSMQSSTTSPSAGAAAGRDSWLGGNFDVTSSAPVPPPSGESAARPKSPLDVLCPGERIDDFQIVGTLGRGAFGVVYLARQISLDRQVALKVTAREGSEGRNMAQLEHEHIVQVFSETVDPSGLRRLLCMQFVPGPTLEAVLSQLRRHDPAEWSGPLLLKIIDSLTHVPASFDPAALRNRELIERSDWVETVCWIGARLAEALDYAHQHGVLHRDVKPGNVLVSQYGRPMLVDFNLSFRPLEVVGTSPEMFGGTLAYMAPEHLRAFSPADPLGPDAVRERADLYSLGVVLYQMLAGRLPFGDRSQAGSAGTVLGEMVAQRCQPPPPVPSEYPASLRQTVARCLDPDPAQRFASGAELSAALEGCRQFHAAERAAPSGGRLRELLGRHPFLGLILLGLFPHTVATVLNILYNYIRIVSHLNEAQQATFVYLILVYDTVAYSLGLGLALRVVLPVYRVWRDARRQALADPRRMDEARALALSWPLWAAVIACLGWLPGAVIFPLVLETWSGPVPWQEQAHLCISFVISGLIALTYSFLFVQCHTVCVFYRLLWIDVRDFHRRAAVELEPVGRRLRLFQVLAGLIPLCGAALMVGIGPQEFTAAEYRSFRFLVTGLIALGLAGFHLAIVSTRVLSHAVTALTRSAS